MRKRSHRRSIGTALAVGLAVMLSSASIAQAQSSDKAPQATDIGVTATEIHIAAIADVDNPIAPGTFQPVVDGVQAAARYINSKAGGGGIAGRKLVVDFIDSKLNPTAARNAVIQACGQDFAMVGTAAFFLSSMADAVNCPDKAGKATGLPDLMAIGGSAEGCSSVSFPVSPPAAVCDTRTQTPQTYRTNQGAWRHLQKQNKNGLHGALIYNSDTKETDIGSRALIAGVTQAGIKADQSVSVSARGEQTVYTPIVQKMKQDSSNFAFSTNTADQTISFLSEAQLQGLTDPNIVWSCTIACYDKKITASSATNRLYIPMSYLPFEETSANKMLANFVRYVTPAKATGFAVFGWVATIAFADAVKSVVAKQGINGLTRAALFDGIRTLTAFNAEGMYGTVNIADKSLTPCVLLVQNQNGKWIRQWPTKKGTFNCESSNVVQFQADFQGS